MAQILGGCLDEMNDLYDKIYSYRCDIASHTRDKLVKRADAWSYAEGIAKQKEDFVRSEVAELQEKIDYCEAEIEKAYNQIKVLQLRLEHNNE